MLRSQLSRQINLSGLRRLTTSAQNIEALDKWIATPQSVKLSDKLSEDHLADLFVSIPTRDGTRFAYEPPLPGSPLACGHHLVFFHPRHPEHALRADGTEPDFCPPEPFTRRMWVGGKINWNHDKPLIIGGKAEATWGIENAVKKGFEKGHPMVFVNQRIKYRMEGMSESDVCVDEERSHVYLAHAAKGSKAPREVKDVPTESDFSLSFTPTPTTLFRFSALIFNAHFNHLDKEFSQQVEGYPERLVHGPLTALMLLESTMVCNQISKLKSFEYRATNPLIVNRELTFHGSWLQDKLAKVWCIDSEGVVGMTGTVEVP